jgi:Pyridoxamine 5'-phosphate oxidase
VEPTAEALDLPKGYGRSTEPLAWPAVRAKLEEAMNYWLVSVRPDGRPHAIPTDGMWLDRSWHFGGAPQAVHMRNVAHHPDVVVHIGDGSWAVIVEGRARWMSPDQDLARRIAEAGKKYEVYGYAPKAEDYLEGGTWAVEATRVLAWTAFPKDATRFRYGPLEGE